MSLGIIANLISVFYSKVDIDYQQDFFYSLDIDKTIGVIFSGLVINSRNK
jgi:hypothetical protein